MEYLIRFKNGLVQTLVEDTDKDFNSIVEELKSNTELYDSIEEIFEAGTPEFEQFINSHRYAPPSEDELAVEEYKRKLQDSDYTVLKSFETVLKILAARFNIELPYLDIMEERQSWRDKINEIEEKYNNPQNGD